MSHGAVGGGWMRLGWKYGPGETWRHRHRASLIPLLRYQMPNLGLNVDLVLMPSYLPHVQQFVVQSERKSTRFLFNKVSLVPLC